MTQNRDRKQAIRERMAATGEPYTEAARAISSRFAGTSDDFLADRHVDLDAGEDGGEMTDADYYDRISASTAVPGRVLGGDVEDQADALADAAARLTEMLAALRREPRPGLDVIAVFRGLSRGAESMAAAAAELRRQDWFDLEDEASPEEAAAWNAALGGLRSASSTFKWVADGWI